MALELPPNIIKHSTVVPIESLLMIICALFPLAYIRIPALILQTYLTFYPALSAPNDNAMQSC